MLSPEPTSFLILSDSFLPVSTFVRTIPLSTPTKWENFLNSSEPDLAQPLLRAFAFVFVFSLKGLAIRIIFIGA
ncbi:Uncharacterised protein [Streptococcus pneumoniae]|nr:Uncharacterised protein [Streptococcus pneumoniae]